MFISEKVVFKKRSIVGEWEGIFHKKKVNFSGGIIILNVYAPNKRL